MKVGLVALHGPGTVEEPGNFLWGGQSEIMMRSGNK